MADPLVIVIAIYDGVTQLDFTGPHQILSAMPDAKMIVASLGGRSIEADGLLFAGLKDLCAIERCDVLLVPGGGSCVGALEDDELLAQIRRLGMSARYLTSVCTGSLFLGAAGLITGKHAACHWAWRDMLPLFGVIPDSARVVRDGNIITGGGVTAGIDFAFSLIAELRGDDVAQRIQLNLEYAPAPPFDGGTPETTRPEIYEAVLARRAPVMLANRVRVEQVATRARTGAAADV